jgi:hypothetical protein
MTVIRDHSMIRKRDLGRILDVAVFSRERPPYVAARLGSDQEQAIVVAEHVVDRELAALDTLSDRGKEQGLAREHGVDDALDLRGESLARVIVGTETGLEPRW